jgi:hypothetical protein
VAVYCQCIHGELFPQDGSGVLYEFDSSTESEVQAVVEAELSIAHTKAHFLSRIGPNTRRYWEDAYVKRNFQAAPELHFVRHHSSVTWSVGNYERQCVYTYLHYTRADLRSCYLNYSFETFFEDNPFRSKNTVITGVRPMPPRYRVTGTDARISDMDENCDDCREVKQDEQECTFYRNEVHPCEVCPTLLPSPDVARAGSDTPPTYPYLCVCVCVCAVPGDHNAVHQSG